MLIALRNEVSHQGSGGSPSHESAEAHLHQLSGFCNAGQSSPARGQSSSPVPSAVSTERLCHGRAQAQFNGSRFTRACARCEEFSVLGCDGRASCQGGPGETVVNAGYNLCLCEDVIEVAFSIHLCYTPLPGARDFPMDFDSAVPKAEGARKSQHALFCSATICTDTPCSLYGYRHCVFHSLCTCGDAANCMRPARYEDPASYGWGGRHGSW